MQNIEQIKAAIKGRRAVQYVRVSKTVQKEAETPERQRQVNAQLAKDLGVVLSREYFDAGARADSEKRLQFQQLMDDARKGLFDVVLLSNQDRLGTKHNHELGWIMHELRKCDVVVVAAVGGCLSSDDAYSSVVSAVGSVASQAELTSKAERSISTRARYTRDGYWSGGQPPYGYDLALVQDGVEQWRVRWMGKTGGTMRRLKVWPDGRTEAFDGKRIPKREVGQHLTLVPSTPERAEAVRQVYRWFTEEAVNLNQIAQRLNDLRAVAVRSEGWCRAGVRAILANPTYASGRPTFNKRGGARYLELSGGRFAAPPLKGDLPVKGRKKDRADWVQAEGEDRGIVPREVWNLAQQKLSLIQGKAKGPRNPGLWLAGLVYCATCGGAKAGMWRGHDKHSASYVCPVFRKVGHANAHGCRLGRVRGSVLEGLLARWLEEAGHKIDIITSDPKPSAMLRALTLEQWTLGCKYLTTLDNMRKVVEAVRGEPTQVEIDGETYDLCDVKREYLAVKEDARAEAEASIQVLHEELTTLARNLGKVRSPLALEAANARMEELEGEIGILQARLVPLDEQADSLMGALVRAREAVREAQRQLAGSEPLRKAEAVRRVLRRIVCHFRYEKHGSMTHSVLERAVFEPVEGEPAELRPGNPPTQHSVAKLLRREFAA